MPKERLYLFDTTLRDGAQTAGIEFSLEDKISVTRLIALPPRAGARDADVQLRFVDELGARIDGHGVLSAA